MKIKIGLKIKLSTSIKEIEVNLNVPPGNIKIQVEKGPIVPLRKEFLTILQKRLKLLKTVPIPRNLETTTKINTLTALYNEVMGASNLEEVQKLYNEYFGQGWKDFYVTYTKN